MFNKKKDLYCGFFLVFFLYTIVGWAWPSVETDVEDRFSKKMLNSIITKVRKVFGLKFHSIIKIYIDCSIYVFLYIIHVHIRHCRTTHSHCVQQKKSNQAVEPGLFCLFSNTLVGWGRPQISICFNARWCEAKCFPAHVRTNSVKMGLNWKRGLFGTQRYQD